MFKRTCTLGIIFVFALYIIKCFIVGCSYLVNNQTQFTPVAAIFLLDVSASSRSLMDSEIRTILNISKRLDGADRATIFIVTQDTYKIYDGNPHKLVDMKKVIEERSKFDEKAYGTAYGLALKKAVDESLRFKEMGYKPMIIVMGDLENEGDVTKQINWNTLPTNMKRTTKYIPDLSLAFLYAHPQKLDTAGEQLKRVFQDKDLILAQEENVNQAVKKIIEAAAR